MYPEKLVWIYNMYPEKLVWISRASSPLRIHTYKILLQ